MKRIRMYFREYFSDLVLPDYLLMYCLFISVFATNLAPIGIVALLLVSLFQSKLKPFRAKEIFSISSPALWMISFFLFHLMGMLWTSNQSFGWMDIGMKLSFLIFPIVFLFAKFNLTREKAITILIGSALVNFFLCIVLAFVRVSESDGDDFLSHFFQSEFTAFMHRSYFATYMALIASFTFIRFWKEKGNWRTLYLLLTLIISSSVVLSMSKAGLIILVLNLFVVLIHQIIKNRRLWRASLVIVAVAVLLLVSLFVTKSSIVARFQNIPQVIRTMKTENNPSKESNMARILVWTSSLKVIKEQPFYGAGTGDVKDVLVAKYHQLGNTGVAKEKLNAHNQYLNTTVQLGYIGLVLLILMLATGIFQAVRAKNFELLVLCIILSVTMLFESFVETQAGIIPFCLLILSFTMLDRNGKERDLKMADER